MSKQAQGVEEDWVAREPGLAQAAHELSRVLRRAKGRIVIVTLIALVGTGLFLRKRLRAVKLYEATVVLRIEETNLRANMGVQREGALVDYIWNIALSRDAILALCDEFDLYAKLADKPEERVEEFREWLSVTASKNYFLEYRLNDDELRTVRVNFNFTDPDPGVAAEVAIATTKAYIAFEIEQRRLAGLDALAAMRDVEARARDAAIERRVRSETADFQGANDLRREQSFGMVLAAVRNAVTDLELMARADEERLGYGLHIVVVDRPLRTKHGVAFWVVSCTFVFGMLLFVTAIGVGAFDSRVVTLEDVERLGFAPVGHVPGFAGQEFGSLAKRLDSAQGG